MESVSKMQDQLKAFILKEFLLGETPEELTASTPLITGGILDSLTTLKLVAFIEDNYNIRLQAHEVDVEHLNTISSIETLVRSKLSKSAAGAL
jgi:acyl carrier protein